jgi:hypothetical protein
MGYNSTRKKILTSYTLDSAANDQNVLQPTYTQAQWNYKDF